MGEKETLSNIYNDTKGVSIPLLVAIVVVIFALIGCYLTTLIMLLDFFV